MIKLSAIKSWGCTLGCAVFLSPFAVRACETQILWSADLSGKGTATFVFDFAHPDATIKVDSPGGLQDVRSVELHVSRSYSDHTGPAIFTLMPGADGKLPAAFSKLVTEADLQKQTTPKIASMTDVVEAVLNGRAYVLVTTKTNPQTQLSGFITMHKNVIYSDNPGDATHDPALHHAVQTTP